MEKVDISAASVAGLTSRDATLENEGGVALGADGLDCKGDVFLSDGFSAKGEVIFLGATIGGNLQCGGATLENEGGNALSADRLVCEGSVFLRGGFSAKGEVEFPGATIGGWLVLIDADLRGTLNLEDASVGTYWDDQESWPKTGELVLNGFTYKNLRNADLQTRLQWLKRASKNPFSPQPYSTLAKVLREQGNERASTEVLIARARARVDHGDLPLGSWAWLRFLGLSPRLVPDLSRAYRLLRSSAEGVDFVPRDFSGSCCSTWPTVLAWLESGLSDEEAQLLNTHVAACDECREKLALMNAVQDVGEVGA